MQALFRFISRCCHWLLLFFALAWGAGLFLVLLRPAWQEWVLATLPGLFSREQAPFAFGARVGVLGLVLVAAWMELLLLRRPPSALTFNTVEGTVSISPVTLTRFVREVLYGCRGIVHVRVDTALDGRKMAVTASVRFTDEQPVSLLATEAQRTVRQRVQQVFGCDLLRDIRIDVSGVDLRAGKPRRLLDWRTQADPEQPPVVASAL